MQDSLEKGVRTAMQAGRFYDSDREALRENVAASIASAEPAGDAAPMALVAPHAGYMYSGRVAGAAYRQVQGRLVDRVIVLGPAHYEDVQGAALASASSWRTPLGDIPVDRAACDFLSHEPGFSVRDYAHEPEHSIEVQLPFLQVALKGAFSIVPILIGKPLEGGLESISHALVRLADDWDRKKMRWLIVASSDTYHGYDGNACRKNDQRLAALFEEFDPPGLQRAFQQREVMACGWAPIIVAMMAVRGRGAHAAKAIRRADSREVTGDQTGYVVGYLAGMIV
ncbi:AmmeMemoRadiSam system protein B [bacterium]|nr:AmmeMemoRadiSam system protein B [bacterium]